MFIWKSVQNEEKIRASKIKIKIKTKEKGRLIKATVASTENWGQL